MRNTILALLAALAGCLTDESIPPSPAHEPEPSPVPAGTPTSTGSSVGGEENTYSHEGGDVDVWELMEQLQREGPPEFTARLHACPKIKYATIGRLLASRGVDLSAEEATSAGRLWRDGDQALGAAQYGARVPESLELTTASASRLFDIFVQAAPEIIANMPEREECTVAGVPTSMFSGSGHCTPDGIACLTGMPATPAHLELCNQILERASTPAAGRVIAVASLAAAAHTCE